MGKKNGYFLLHRSIFQNPIVTKDADYFMVWIYILSQAEWEDGKIVDFGGKKITLKAGQFTCGIKRQMLYELQKINPSLSETKLYRIVKCYSDAKQIATQRSARCSLFTVLNWDSYQNNAKQNESKLKVKCKTEKSKVPPNEITNTLNNKIKNIEASPVVEKTWEELNQEEWDD